MGLHGVEGRPEYGSSRGRRRLAFVLAEVEDGADDGVIQGGNCLRLLLKKPQPLGIAGKSCRQHLDRDLAVEPRITRTIHLTHAASTEWGKNFIWTKFGAGGREHVCV